MQLFYRKLYRISLVCGVGLGYVNTGLLCLTVLEEIGSYLREQSVGKNILLLLNPLLALLTELRKLGLNQVCGSAGDRCNIADALLLNYELSELPRELPRTYPQRLLP